MITCKCTWDDVEEWQDTEEWRIADTRLKVSLRMASMTLKQRLTLLIEQLAGYSNEL